MKPAPAVYIGHQEAPNGFGFDLYNLTEAIPGHSQGSTVTDATLRKKGFYLPPKESNLSTQMIRQAIKESFG